MNVVAALGMLLALFAQKQDDPECRVLGVEYAAELPSYEIEGADGGSTSSDAVDFIDAVKYLGDPLHPRTKEVVQRASKGKRFACIQVELSATLVQKPPGEMSSVVKKSGTGWKLTWEKRKLVELTSYDIKGKADTVAYKIDLDAFEVLNSKAEPIVKASGMRLGEKACVNGGGFRSLTRVVGKESKSTEVVLLFEVPEGTDPASLKFRKGDPIPLEAKKP